MNKTTLGLDLSLTGTGLVLIKNGKIMVQKLIKSKPAGKLPIDELRRIQKIVEHIDNQIMTYKEFYPIEMALIEGLAFSRQNTTALMQLGALNYFTRAMLANWNIPFVIVAPTTLKKFVTSNGHAKKDGMMLETYKRWGESFDDDNLCDAFGLAMIGQTYLSPENKTTAFQNEVLKVLSEQLKQIA